MYLRLLTHDLPKIIDYRLFYRTLLLTRFVKQILQLTSWYRTDFGWSLKIYCRFTWKTFPQYQSKVSSAFCIYGVTCEFWDDGIPDLRSHHAIALLPFCEIYIYRWELVDLSINKPIFVLGPEVLQNSPTPHGYLNSAKMTLWQSSRLYKELRE